MAKRGRLPNGVDRAAYDRGPYAPTPAVAHRLAVWRKRAAAGDPVADIAAALGVTARHLVANVCVARRFGHPDAIHHPDRGPGRRAGWYGQPVGAVTPDMQIRMERWRRLCQNGLTTQQIADELGLSVEALRRSVSRARAAGCRAAIVHPLAPECGTGIGHLVHSGERASRLRRLRREQGRLAA